MIRTGPRLMRHRRPFNIRPLIVLYNMAMVVVNAYMVVQVRTANCDPYLNFPRAAISRTGFPPPASAGQRRLGLLRVQDRRVPGHALLHPEEEGPPHLVPARVPPLERVHALVDRRQVGAGRQHLRPRAHQLHHPRHHVFVLHCGGPGPHVPAVPLVEEVPHRAAAGAPPPPPPPPPPRLPRGPWRGPNPT
ncbi:hypothetical protein ONE63_003288 [Megalurothrips usitatus]|uniref:Very-long-chain 3-oxoacyl-CoA synthase n=1 Tax=Megalurothrips usitatus TaxID=439358 RepID=A0AAV7XAJ1_9NEOP|nr:hypothetical protein ONE63_003288 [Megalurothrips usitatus]